jgi:hypothetical protein
MENLVKGYGEYYVEDRKVTGKNYKELVLSIIDKGEVELENGKKLSILNDRKTFKI